MSWSTADASVAGVSATGLVTAVANGTTTLTATASSISATASVSVQQVPTAVRMSRDSLRFDAPGDTARVAAAINDANGHPVSGVTVAWRSSDTAVARVDATGLVTSVANGATTVTASAGPASGVVSVRVERAGPVVLTATLPYGEVEKSYTATLVASGEAWVYAWSVVDGALPGTMTLAEDGRISGTPFQAGVYAFTVQARDRNTGRTASRELSLVVHCGPAVCIGNGYRLWHNAVYSQEGPGLALSAASFQHGSPWTVGGMDHYARIPRESVPTDPGHAAYRSAANAWDRLHGVVANIEAGLAGIGVPGIGSQGSLTADQYRAVGSFVQAMAMASVAVLYDQGLVGVGVEGTGVLVPHRQVLDTAFALFDRAAELAAGSTFTLPSTWMRANVTSADLVRISRSMKARYRAAAARTPEERAAVDWAAIIADVDAGVTGSFTQTLARSDWPHVLDYANSLNWGGIPYWIYGMADQSGAFQRWLEVPVASKNPYVGQHPTLIVSPDTRFPRGETLAAQRSAPGAHFGAPSSVTGLWVRPERGTWHWSLYLSHRFEGFTSGSDLRVDEINVVEMDLLKAEGLLRLGDPAGAAELVNRTRATRGLNATNASGLNTSCVPRLPSGACGDLMEALKWEKRIETPYQGLFGAPWFFDGRGWGDLWAGTALEFPVPCEVLQAMGRPCYTFGGIGGASASPGSRYAWPGER